VNLTDLAPTLMEMATGAVPEHMQGKSLLPILTGRAVPDTHHEAVRCEFYSCVGPSVGAEHWPDSYGSMLRTRKYKVSVYHGFASGELFDLEEDPGEFENLWDDPEHRSVREEMVRRCFDATVAANRPNMPIMTGDAEARRNMGAGPEVHFASRLENGTWISSYQDANYHVEVRHDPSSSGRLYDLQSPKPDRDRWSDPAYRDIRFDVVNRCFDAFVFSIDPGPERIGRY